MNTQRAIAVVGAGGHAKVVISVLQATGFSVEAIFDDNRDRWGSEILGVAVRGGVSELEGFRPGLAVIAIGDNAVRQRLAERFPSVEWASAVHPAAYVHPSVRLGAGTVVFAGGVVQPDAMIGEHVIVNTGATVDHDCVVEHFAHLAPGVHLAGAVHVGEGVLMGVGSVAIPNRVIGEWTVVGAGGVVVHDVPPRVTAVGVPAIPRV